MNKRNRCNTVFILNASIAGILATVSTIIALWAGGTLVSLFLVPTYTAVLYLAIAALVMTLDLKSKLAELIERHHTTPHHVQITSHQTN